MCTGSEEITFSLVVFNPSLFFKEAVLDSHDYYHPSKSRRWRTQAEDGYALECSVE